MNKTQCASWNVEKMEMGKVRCFIFLLGMVGLYFTPATLEPSPRRGLPGLLGAHLSRVASSWIAPGWSRASASRWRWDRTQHAAASPLYWRLLAAHRTKQFSNKQNRQLIAKYDVEVMSVFHRRFVEALTHCGCFWGHKCPP